MAEDTAQDYYIVLTAFPGAPCIVMVNKENETIETHKVFFPELAPTLEALARKYPQTKENRITLFGVPANGDYMQGIQEAIKRQGYDVCVLEDCFW